VTLPNLTHDGSTRIELAFVIGRGCRLEIERIGAIENRVIDEPNDTARI